jgi:hypothetical protein
MRRALAALSLCVAIFEFEQPLGHAAQGFSNHVTVEWCSTDPGHYVLVATERLVDAEGRRVGDERKRFVYSKSLPAASPRQPSDEEAR